MTSNKKVGARGGPGNLGIGIAYCGVSDHVGVESRVTNTAPRIAKTLSNQVLTRTYLGTYNIIPNVLLGSMGIVTVLHEIRSLLFSC